MCGGAVSPSYLYLWNSEYGWLAGRHAGPGLASRPPCFLSSSFFFFFLPTRLRVPYRLIVGSGLGCVLSGVAAEQGEIPTVIPPLPIPVIRHPFVHGISRLEEYLSAFGWARERAPLECRCRLDQLSGQQFVGERLGVAWPLQVGPQAIDGVGNHPLLFFTGSLGLCICPSRDGAKVTQFARDLLLRDVSFP